MLKILTKNNTHWSVRRLEIYSHLAESDPKAYAFMYHSCTKALADNIRMTEGNEEYRLLMEANLARAKEIAIPLLQPYWDRLEVEDDLEEVIEGSDGEV